jgi:hypothetical protein
MFEDLRREGESSPFYQQGDEPDPLLDAPVKKKGGGGMNFKMPRKFLGMTAFQRFLVSTFLFVFVCVAWIGVLFVMGAMVFF